MGSVQSVKAPRRCLLRIIGVLFGAVVVGALLHRRYRDWGATPEEIDAALPGDELVAGPAIMSTRAVTINAPADEVWPWLIQIGYDRGGFYSYDWLENLMGLAIHSASCIDPALQNPSIGDRIRLVPAGWMGLPEGMALPIAQLIPGRAMVLREDPAEGPWDGVWSFHIVALDERSCRLISRGRAAHTGLGSRIADEVMDPVTLIMTRKMLLGIKERAERNAKEAHTS